MSQNWTKWAKYALFYCKKESGKGNMFLALLWTMQNIAEILRFSRFHFWIFKINLFDKKWVNLTTSYFEVSFPNRGSTCIFRLIFSFQQYGAVLGIAYFSAFVVSLIMGSFGDRVGAKNLYTFGGLIQGLSGLLFGCLQFVQDKNAFVGSSYILRLIRHNSLTRFTVVPEWIEGYAFSLSGAWMELQMP